MSESQTEAKLLLAAYPESGLQHFIIILAAIQMQQPVSKQPTFLTRQAVGHCRAAFKCKRERMKKNEKDLVRTTSALSKFATVLEAVFLVLSNLHALLVQLHSPIFQVKIW